MAKSVQILVVEDEGIVAHDIRSTLEEWGYYVPKVAFTGEEAIKEMGITSPDLILMDIRLSGDIDGITAVEKIHRDADVPVVYLTAYTDDDTLDRAKKTEPFGYILKPYKETELSMTIQLALSLHNMDRDLKSRVEKLEHGMQNISHAPEDKALAATVVHKLKNSLGLMKTILFNVKMNNKDTSLNNYLSDMELILSESDTIIDKWFTDSKARDSSGE